MSIEKTSKNEQGGSELEVFQKKIDELKKEEEKSGETAYFEGCEPDELEREDMEIYNELVSETLTLTIEKVREYQKNTELTGNESQKVFARYIANKFMAMNF